MITLWVVGLDLFEPFDVFRCELKRYITIVLRVISMLMGIIK